MKSLTRPPDFDRIARPYRWLEYLTFGPLLQQTRVHFLPRLQHCRSAVLFGDGDGRFIARLFAQNQHLAADAVDTSAAMLSLLRRRALPLSAPGVPTNPPRLRTHNQSALTFLPDRPHDLVATHFFLDCLTQLELDTFIQQLAPTLAPGALWVLSDFRIPPGVLRVPAQSLIRVLYFAFRVLTGLRATHIPLHSPALTRSGFVRLAQHHRLFGLLTSELWQRATPPVFAGK